MNAQQGRRVAFLVPDAIDDAGRVSGGNVYDQRIRDGLRADGWELRMVLIAENGRGRIARALSQLPDGTLVLVDGLLVGREPEALADHRARLRLILLVHMLAADLTEGERDAVRAARRVIATSNWTRTELLAQDAADPHRIVVAHPGVDPAPAATVSASGARLLCVATVAPHKGQDALVQALAALTDLDGWTCTLVGSVHAAPDFVAGLRAAIHSAGLADRITLTGTLTGRALEDAYSRADLVVLPSRTESYGMAVAEALARGIPVVASGVGGIPEAIGRSDAGMIVPPGDPWALGVALRHWLTSPIRRRDLTAAALAARAAARPWSTTTAIIASTFAETATEDLASAESPRPQGARAASALLS